MAEVKSVAKTPPLFMIDQEGGRVDRLRHIVPGLPSVQGFEEGERPAELSEWFGRVIGMALALLRHRDRPRARRRHPRRRRAERPRRRTFGSDPETVIELAGAFMRGLHASGVAACLKHWPGIGLGLGNPHYGATVIDAPVAQLIERDLLPFQRLGNEAGAIMIGHGTYPQIDEPDLPATLSRRMTTDLLRNFLGFDGVAISDDMEMHAVSDLGSYEDLSERALMAGNDAILFCSHVERVPELQAHLARRVAEDAKVRARFEEAVAALRPLPRALRAPPRRGASGCNVQRSPRRSRALHRGVRAHARASRDRDPGGRTAEERSDAADGPRRVDFFPSSSRA